MCYRLTMREAEALGERIAEQAAHLDAATHVTIAVEASTLTKPQAVTARPVLAPPSALTNQAALVPDSVPPSPPALDGSSALALRGVSKIVLGQQSDHVHDRQNTPDPSAVACFADGTCMSSDAARRLCCDAAITEVIEDQHGNAISIGRKRRTIPGAMKRALLKRDKTCRFPGCSNRLFLEGHHITHWADGGETSLRNIAMLCSYHHRFAHEHHYQIAFDGHDIQFRDEWGRIATNAPSTPRPANLGMAAIHAGNTPLNITAKTNEPGWDGSRINYGNVIDELVRADDKRRAYDDDGWPIQVDEREYS